MNNVVEIKKETKEETAQFLVNYFGGEWKENFSSDPGSTVTDGCWKYLKQLVLTNNKIESELIKIVKQFEFRGYVAVHGFDNGKPQINFK
tara:strand:+ start:428 stop:697 length:270 start_codon:yes stop_codon:yes gene_type:complete